MRADGLDQGGRARVDAGVGSGVAFDALQQLGHQRLVGRGVGGGERLEAELGDCLVHGTGFSATSAALPTKARGRYAHGWVVYGVRGMCMGDSPKKLDRYDLSILQHLQEDGRMSVAALSEKIALSANATNERLRRLVRDGVIEGFHARVSAAALDRPLITFIEVKLDRTAPDVFEAFAEAVRSSDEIEECHMVAGGFDYLLKTRHRDMTAYRAFLADALLALPGVRETHTFTVMEAVKGGRGWIPV